MDVKKTITQAEFARRLKIKSATVAVLIRRGAIKTVATADGLRLIPVSEVERYARVRRK